MKWFNTLRQHLLLLTLGHWWVGTAVAQQPPHPQLRVLTYNIHHGEAMDGKFDYERLARLITDLNPDVVALQEVDRGTRRASRVDQPAVLEELTGMKAVFSHALVYDGGEYGEALLSRWPFDQVRPYHLPFEPHQEPRVALAARIKPDNGLPEFVLVGTHLDHTNEETRLEQTQRINRVLPAEGGPPIILAGDFNARPGSRPMNELLTDRWIDAIAPRSRIDYVLLRAGDPWRVSEVNIVDEQVVSDHLPVLAVLEWRGETAEVSRVQQGARSVERGRVALFEFDGNTDNTAETAVRGSTGGTTSFVEGLEAQALRLRSGDTASTLTLERANLPFDRGEDFSVQFWVRTTVGPESRMVLLSQKVFEDGSLASQKQPGWVFYMSHGTWAWNMGSGGRRITYERDNGEHMPLNDGRWHQLTMTYDSALSEARLFYDGNNKVVYNVEDSTGFDFTSAQPLVVGWAGTLASPQQEIVPAIYAGAQKLQELVDSFNTLNVSEVEPGKFVNLIVEPKRFFDEKVSERAEALGAGGAAFIELMRTVDFEPVSRIESELMHNPYTIHQAFSFMEAAPLSKIFSLVDGEVTIDDETAQAFTERERLYPADFDIDNLAIWDHALSAEEVLDSYSAYVKPAVVELEKELSSITAGVWNIFHGGKHFTVDEHGWDSRRAIAQILDRENIDVVMMQETYSSGDFIAAELGYYFATTIDRDYLNQGANISVLSRYPIMELHVQEESPFMNVGAKIAISETQDLWVMSNWYGMDQFPDVFSFHEGRFAASATIPVIFGGDFNAVPHADGGESIASRAMLDAGFTDAFRSRFPDVQRFPGASHRSGRRIDQLYYKGASMKNTSTSVTNTWPVGFPSDHYLIRAAFDLK